ncbi:MAG: acyl carrier protein [Oscillospiraceae bacterium]|nr:acyl carrier protein [Oscillospiraceae bacterium]
MEKILQILRELRPDVDFESARDLVDGGILDSFDIVALVTELNDAFGVEIGVLDLTPENFASVETIAELVDAKLR